MVVKKSLLKASTGIVTTLAITLLLTTFTSATAQNKADTTKKTFLASLEKNAKVVYFTKPANVVFPDVLKGNEEQCVSYIENFCNTRRNYLVEMYTKGKKLLPMAASILQKYDLPEELKVLLAIESAYNANAVSKAGAVGYWQFMGETAREYGMRTGGKKVSGKKGRRKTVTIADDRRNFSMSTNAAARYLKDRQKNLDDDILLMVASYNCGIGNVWNAMKRCDIDDPDFWDIKKYLPVETQAYVMKFIALNVVFNNYELFTENKLTFTPEKIMMPPGFEKGFTENGDVSAGTDF